MWNYFLPENTEITKLNSFNNIVLFYFLANNIFFYKSISFEKILPFKRSEHLLRMCYPFLLCSILKEYFTRVY